VVIKRFEVMAIVVNGKVMKSDEIGKSDERQVLQKEAAQRQTFDDYSRLSTEQTLKTLNDGK